jgi:hypothetical protein
VTHSKHVEGFKPFLTHLLRNDTCSTIGTQLVECNPCIIEMGPPDSALPPKTNPRAKRDRNEKRREHRFVTNESAVLQVTNPLSHEHLEVRLLDVSKNGLRLFVQVDVLPGSHVMVRMKDNLAFGEARYCVTAPEGFFVGVKLSDFIPV